MRGKSTPEGFPLARSRSWTESLEGGWTEAKHADDPQGAEQDLAACRDEVRQMDGRSMATAATQSPSRECAGEFGCSAGAQLEVMLTGGARRNVAGAKFGAVAYSVGVREFWIRNSETANSRKCRGSLSITEAMREFLRAREFRGAPMEFSGEWR